MSGASSTQLNAGTGGDLIYDEDIGGGVKMAATKLHTGALGVDGGAVTAANPLPVSDVNLPAVGQKSAAASVPVVLSSATLSSAASLATTGVVIKGSAGAALWLQAENGTAGTIYLQIHNLASGTPSALARPAWYSPSIATVTVSVGAAIGHATYGIPCSTGMVLIASSTQATYTAIVTTTIGYNIVSN